MLVTGSPYADLFARIGAPSRHEARDAGAQQRPQSAPLAAGSNGAGSGVGSGIGSAAGADEGPAYFSMISPISHGSLAAAYQVIRGREPVAAAAPGIAAAGEPAILSGLGVPAALSAYGEVLDAG